MNAAAGVGKLLYALPKPAWVLINAENHGCGRLATDIATFLQGKHKPVYSPQVSSCGDHVVVLNASLMRYNDLTMKGKVYYSHSGYPGGLKERKLSHVLKDDPCDPLRRAVYGMLPRNHLRRVWMSRLFIYPKQKHALAGRMPEGVPFLIEAAQAQVRDTTPRLTYPGNHWPEDFGAVVKVIDTYPPGERSPFDLVDFQKLHEARVAQRASGADEA